MIARFINPLRLALFALGYGLTGALVGGTLNRIMVAELSLPISLVGLFFAAPLFIVPLRAWMGYRSDGHPIRGLRREPYIIVGAAFAGIGVIAAIILLLQLQPSPILLAAGVMIAFLIHEFGRNLSHNSFQALLADKFSDQARARAITLYEIVTLLGLIIGAGGIAASLRDYAPGKLISVTIAIAVVTFILSVVAALRNEKRSEEIVQVSQTARAQPFMATLKQIAIGDKQVRLFFILIIFVIVGTLAQDVLLEPYGALVLNMDVEATSRLTMFWGLGVMAAMLASGLFLIKWLGHVNVLRIGLVMTIFVFAGVIASGMSGNTGMFRSLVMVMGLGTGLAGAGLLTSIINFTTVQRAGLLLGVWGIAMVAGRSIGSLFGGIIVDSVSVVTGGNHFVAYSVVFALEAALLVAALVMVTRLNVNESSAHHEEEVLDLEAATGAVSFS